MAHEDRVVPSDVGAGTVLHGRTYTPGFSDALGSRRVAHGRPGEPILEVLEFTRALADAPGFERALRTRVEALRDVVPVSLAAVYAVEHREGLGLCLVTEHVPGRRLAELSPADLGSALALDLIRTVTPVLGALNQTGVGVAHGVLSTGRVVAGDDGRLIVVEHVLGWAVEALKYSRAQLHGLGIVVPAGVQVRFDGRTDMVQLGFLALSVWLRRPLDPADCPDTVPELLDEAAGQEDSPEFADHMRAWLERAMQIGSRPFASAHDAMEALDDLPAEFKALDTESEAGLLAFHSEGSQSKLPPPAQDPGAFSVAQLRAAIEQRQATAETPAAPAARFMRPAVWIVAVLAVIAIGEAVAVGLLVSEKRAARAATSTIQPTDSSRSDPLPAPTPTTGVGDARDVATPPPADVRGSSGATATTAGQASATRPVGRGFGGLTIASALDFLVTADGTPVGSKGAPIALPEGSHRLEFVNEALGFRHAQTVKVAYGQMTVVRVPMPTGRISVNAMPWAEVAIDGRAVGETPIANYSLPVGTHEVVFRHPELGERRQTIVVKVGEYVRVTQTFDRSPQRSAR